MRGSGLSPAPGSDDKEDRTKVTDDTRRENPLPASPSGINAGLVRFGRFGHCTFPVSTFLLCSSAAQVRHRNFGV